MSARRGRPFLARRGRARAHRRDLPARGRQRARGPPRPTTTIALLRESGLVGLWVPECFGGAEVGPLECLEAVEALSYADGATGWVLMAWQVAMASAAAYLPAPAANAVFGDREHPDHRRDRRAEWPRGGRGRRLSG